MKTLLLVAAASASIAMHAPAHAISLATATLDHFGVVLVDLNPNDGILPSIVFPSDPLVTPYGSYTTTSVGDMRGNSKNAQNWNNEPFGPAHVESSAGGANAAASVSGSVFSGSLSLNASGSAVASRTLLTADYSAVARGGDTLGQAFTLSPYTLALFTGTLDLHAYTSAGFEEVNGSNESASASATLNVSGPSPTGSDFEGRQLTEDSRLIEVTFETVFDPDTGMTRYTGEDQSLKDVSLAGSFTNHSATRLTGMVSALVVVDGYSPIAAPVPEPGSWAMMLAGLATCGLVARRRRAQRSFTALTAPPAGTTHALRHRTQ